MIKRDLLRRHSRHTALLMAVTLACTNTGMAVNTVYAQETGSEAGSGEKGGSMSGSSSGSQDGSESGSGSEEGEGSGSEGGEGSGSEEGEGSGSEGGEGSGSEEGESSGSEEGESSGSEEGESSGSEEGESSGSEEGESSGSEEGESSGSEEGESSGSEEGESSGSEEGESGGGENGNQGGTVPGETIPGETVPGGSAAGNTANPGANAPAAPAVKPDEKASYSITYTVNPEEGAVIEGDTTVEEGDSLSFSVTASEGYQIGMVTANGEEFFPIEEGEDGINLYEISDVSEDLDIEVEVHNEAQLLKAEGTEVISAEADGLQFELESEYFAAHPNCTLSVSTSEAPSAWDQPIRGSSGRDGIEGYKSRLLSNSKRAFEEEGAAADSEVRLIGYYAFKIDDADQGGAIRNIEDPVMISVGGLDLSDTEPSHYKVFASDAGDFVECDPDSIEVSGDSVRFAAIKGDRKSGVEYNFSKTLHAPMMANTVIVYGVTKLVSHEAPEVDYRSELVNLALPSESRYENSHEIQWEINNQVTGNPNLTYITVTIPENYNGEPLTISAEDKIAEAFTKQTRPYVPGESTRCELIIQNKSSHDIEYVPGSFGFEMSESKELAFGFVGSGINGGNDGKRPAAMHPARILNDAMNALVQEDYDSQYIENHVSELLSDENVDRLLKLKGYSGLDELYKYYIDYYNIKTESAVNSLDDLSLDEIEDRILGGGRSGVYSPVTESDPAMAEFFNAVFYHRYLNFLPESYSGEETDYNLASFAWEQNDAFENDAKDHFGTIPAGTSSEPMIFDMKINGMTNNTYTNYKFGFNFGAEFVKAGTLAPDPEPNPDPVTPGGGSGGGGGGGNTGGHRADPNPSGGPGVEILPEEVPLAALPEMSTPVSIPDGEVPLEALPKTGNKMGSEITFLFSGLLLELYGMLGIRKKED